MKLQRLLSLACVTFAVTFAGFSGAASAQTPDVLNVATDATFPPMEFTENGARTGFDVDLMNALAKAMGKRVRMDRHRLQRADSGPDRPSLRRRDLRHLHHRRAQRKWSTSPTRTTRAGSSCW